MILEKFNIDSYVLKCSIHPDLNQSPDHCRQSLRRVAGSTLSGFLPLVLVGNLHSRETATKAGTRVFPGSKIKK